MLFLLVPIVLAAPTPIASIENPRARGSWVSDMAGVIPAPAEARIDARIDALQAQLGAEIAVVTVGEVEGVPKDVAGELLNAWGVGAAQANNGILVLLVVDQRRVEIEVGYGLEGVLTDAATGALLDRAVIPRFREGDLGGGLEAGVEALDQALRRSPEEAAIGTGGVVDVPGGSRPSTARSGPSSLLWGLGAGGAGLLGSGAYLLAQRRRRQCPVCRKPMVQLSEEADDAHLHEGAKTEEALGSVDYEVRICEEHDQVKVIPHTRWFSGHSRCVACGHRTARSSSRTIHTATYDHGGLVEVTSTCHHCRHVDTRTRSTPRRTRTTTHSASFGGGGRSGGGRSGGSFGGGRSGGGGAGRSW